MSEPLWKTDPIFVACETYMRHHQSVKNKTELAAIIGVSKEDLYSFFAGNRILHKSVIATIANFFKIEIGTALMEYENNVKKYKIKAGL